MDRIMWLTAVVVFTMAPAACGSKQTTVQDKPAQAQIANPASVYCIEQGGTLEIRKDPQGGEYGVCIFKDGSECEEWAFFRGECSSATQNHDSRGQGPP